MSNKTELQSNNNDLQGILNIINGLPAANTNNLPTLSQPATVDKVLSGYDYIDGDGNQKVGTMTNRGAVSQTLAVNGSYTIPAGYHNGSGKVTQNLTTKTAATYGAKTSDQTISSGQYLSGIQTIKKVEQSGLSAENIVKGKTVTIKSNGSNLWSVTGTGTTITPSTMTAYSGSSYPSSPKENDVFANTQTNKYYIYSNGAWQEITHETLSFVLYDKGVFNTDYTITGDLAGGDVYINNTNIRIYNTGYPVDYTYRYINLGNFIDITSYKSLKVTLEKQATFGYAKPVYIALGTTKGNRDLKQMQIDTSSLTFTLDVSDINRNAYINIGIQVGVQSTGTTEVFISKIELE